MAGQEQHLGYPGSTPTYNDVFQSVRMQEQFSESQQLLLGVRGLLVQV